MERSAGLAGRLWLGLGRAGAQALGAAGAGGAGQQAVGRTAAWARSRGAPVVLVAPQGVPLATAALGLLRAGTPMVPAHPDLTPPEISRLLLATRAGTVLTTSLRVPGVLEAQKLAEKALGSRYPLEVVTTDSEMVFSDVTSWEQVVSHDQGPLPPLPDPSTTALLVESAGRIIKLSHANILANCLQVSEVFPMKEGSVVGAVVPLYYGYGLVHALVNPLINGARVVVIDKWRPKSVARAVAEHGITVLPATWDWMEALAKSGALRGLEAAAGLGPPPARQPRLPSSLRLASFHGMAWGPALLHWDRALPGTTLDVLDPDETGVGALQAEGAQLPGPVLTGDRCRKLPDGRIRLAGRDGCSVWARGLEVDPGEVEAALEGHPGVAAAGVWGSPPLGLVVPRDPDRPPPARELRVFLSSRLAPYKLPLRFSFVSSLPLLPDGRRDRMALQRLLPPREFVAVPYV